jgi:hypothetical protein
MGRDAEGWSKRKDWVLSICVTAWRSATPSPPLRWQNHVAFPTANEARRYFATSVEELFKGMNKQKNTNSEYQLITM